MRLARIPSLVTDVRELFDTNAREARLAARKRLAESTLLVVVGIVLLVVTFGSILIVLVEAPAEGANILTGNDAVWWSIVTVSTVGYGDRFPVTTVGRFIGTIMIIMGVSLFSVLTSYIATQFMARRKADRTQRDGAAARGHVQAVRRNSARQTSMTQRPYAPSSPNSAVCSTQRTSEKRTDPSHRMALPCAKTRTETWRWTWPG